MKIDAVDIYHLAVPLIEPWRTAYGEDAEVETVLVEMHSGGESAWGESSPLAAPCYSPDWAGGVFAVLERWMAPAIVGAAIGAGEELQERLAHFKGNTFAKAALDVAWWSLEAQRQGRPLHVLINEASSASSSVDGVVDVAVGADFGVLDSIDELLRRVGEAFDEGFPRVKLKFRPGWDVTMLRAVRERFPQQDIHIDCNAGYRMDALDTFCRLDDFQLAMIEQPLAYDDLVDHARLQAAIRTPVCLDESVRSVEAAEMAIEIEACRYINIKPGRVGGLTPAIAIHDMCREAGVGCWVGGMLETAVGARICLALATLEGLTYPADIFPSARFFHEDPGDAPLETHLGQDGQRKIATLDAPGLGCRPRPDLLEKYTKAKARIVASPS
ncbi:MAG: o-succinylbenzoate synthase [Planctomycetales bacterium]|nr:o-succinylbenzoate synthase [Planctomycetales bacterium]